MAWSIFREGGGDSAAVQWAHDFLAALGVAQSPGNVQFVYDWEKSEGGGGKWNPLNQGPVPGHSELTTTGSQYGGGAADFASYGAGIQGAVDYLHMSNYKGVLAGLTADNANAARTALIESPWASSHYGGSSSSTAGNHFSTATIPGGTQNMTANNSDIHIPLTPWSIPSPGDIVGGVGGSVVSGVGDSIVSAITGVLKPLKIPFENMAVRVGLVLFGAVAVLVGVATLMRDGGSVSSTVANAVPTPSSTPAPSSGGGSRTSGPGRSPGGSTGSTGKAPGVSSTVRDTGHDVSQTSRAVGEAAGA